MTFLIHLYSIYFIEGVISETIDTMSKIRNISHPDVVKRMIAPCNDEMSKCVDTKFEYIRITGSSFMDIIHWSPLFSATEV